MDGSACSAAGIFWGGPSAGARNAWFDDVQFGRCRLDDLVRPRNGKFCGRERQVETRLVPLGALFFPLFIADIQVQRA
jgi:hypothetical protein